MFGNLEQCWQKFVGFFFSNQPDIDVGTIKFDLQKLYNRFYLDVITKGKETVRSISKQNTQLNDTKLAFSQLGELISNDLLAQYENVRTAAELYEFFLKNKFSNELTTTEDLTNILSLLVEAVKAKFAEDKDIQSVNVTVIKRIITDQKHFVEEDGKYFVEQANQLGESSLTSSLIFT